MATTYAFCDTNAGFLQGLVAADSLNDALEKHAADVGLIEEIGLDLSYAAVSQEDAQALEAWSEGGCKSDLPSHITWRTLTDEDVREVLGFGPRQ